MRHQILPQDSIQTAFFVMDCYHINPTRRLVTLWLLLRSSASRFVGCMGLLSFSLTRSEFFLTAGPIAPAGFEIADAFDMHFEDHGST